MTISIIAAVAKNRAIGFENKLIYWLPNDLKRFKALTTGHTIIMGRNTFLSLPKGALPNRRNIVLSRTQADFPGCDCYRSLDEALAHCSADEDVYIIGGASVYEQAIAIANRLCLTEIDDTPAQADTFFPEFHRAVEGTITDADDDLKPTASGTAWRETAREDHDIDEKHLYRYSFVDYERA